MTFLGSHREKTELYPHPLQHICNPALKKVGGQHQARAALPPGKAQYPLYMRLLFAKRYRKFQQWRTYIWVAGGATSFVSYYTCLFHNGTSKIFLRYVFSMKFVFTGKSVALGQNSTQKWACSFNFSLHFQKGYMLIINDTLKNKFFESFKEIIQRNPLEHALSNPNILTEPAS